MLNNLLTLFTMWTILTIIFLLYREIEIFPYILEGDTFAWWHQSIISIKLFGVFPFSYKENCCLVVDINTQLLLFQEYKVVGYGAVVLLPGAARPVHPGARDPVHKEHHHINLILGVVFFLSTVHLWNKLSE